MKFIKLNLKNSGVWEWLIVRFSAITMIVYTVYLSRFILYEHDLSYEKWCIFFYSNKTKAFNMIVLLLILEHAWIGMRHILEDYIQSTNLRTLIIRLISIILFIYLLLGTIIIWGI